LASVPQPMISRILSAKWKNLTLETVLKVSSVFGIYPEFQFSRLAAEKGHKAGPVPKSASCFWDVDTKDIHLPEHGFFVAERILSYGERNEIRWLFKNVDRDTIVDVIKNSRNIAAKSATF